MTYFCHRGRQIPHIYTFKKIFLYQSKFNKWVVNTVQWSVCMCVCVCACVFLHHVSLESAERLYKSPGELRGAAGSGQSNTLLVWDGWLHSGTRPLRTWQISNHEFWLTTKIEAEEKCLSGPCTLRSFETKNGKTAFYFYSFLAEFIDFVFKMILQIQILTIFDKA